MSRKLLTLALLALACLMLFSACSDDGVPDGMVSVTLEGEPFILYVPENWSDNRSSGISSAHSALKVIASARYYPLDETTATLDEYVGKYIEECKSTYDDFSFSRKDSKLGKDAPAARIEFDFSTAENATTKAIHYITIHGTDAVILSFYCNTKDFPEYAETFEAGKSGNLVLFGGTGLGKTHLSSAVARGVIERGYDVFYVSAVSMLSDFERERFGNSAGGETGVGTDRYFSCDLLIIDDLGTEVNNQFTTSVLYNLINTRLNKRQSTVINTNLTQEEFRRRYWNVSPPACWASTPPCPSSVQTSAPKSCPVRRKEPLKHRKSTAERCFFRIRTVYSSKHP